MDPVSILIGLLGLGMSGYAIITAKSAKQAASQAVQRKDDQEDREYLKDLIIALVEAKNSAKRRESGALEIKSAGHSSELDIYHLSEAHDKLCTALPLSFGNELKATVDAAAAELKAALNAIQNPTTSNRDGWKDALSILQTLIPRLRQEERQMKNKEILAH